MDNPLIESVIETEGRERPTGEILANVMDQLRAKDVHDLIARINETGVTGERLNIATHILVLAKKLKATLYYIETGECTQEELERLENEAEVRMNSIIATTIALLVDCNVEPSFGFMIAKWNERQRELDEEVSTR